MGWRDLVLRLRALAGRRKAESNLDEELSFHLEMEARKYRAAGMPEIQARQSARVEFGGLEQVREQCRDFRGIGALENLARDLRWGARLLRKTPLFSTVAVASLAIGIGANTAVFSLLDVVLLRMLPVSHPEQLVVARWGAHASLDFTSTWASGGNDGHGNWTRNPHDPASLLAASIAVVAVALVAAVIPARRAMRIDPCGPCATNDRSTAFPAVESNDFRKKNPESIV